MKHTVLKTPIFDTTQIGQLIMFPFQISSPKIATRGGQVEEYCSQTIERGEEDEFFIRRYRSRELDLPSKVYQLLLYFDSYY